MGFEKLENASKMPERGVLDGLFDPSTLGKGPTSMTLKTFKTMF